MSSSWEELLKLSNKLTIDELSSTTELRINNQGLNFLHESIGLLTNLKGLWLGQNKLSLLPETIGCLLNLIELSLYDNQLSSLPASIGQLTKLTVLWIFNNPITELPESITCLRNLKKLQIESIGSISIQRAPIGITELPCWTNDQIPYMCVMPCSRALKILKLYSNHINENLTDVSSMLGMWKVCDRINISNNRISTLPDQLRILKDLREISLANNMFDTFPEVLLKMNWLTSLNIAGNSFTELPEGITKLTRLSSLVIADTNGKATIQHAPIGISALPCFHSSADLKKLISFDPFALRSPLSSASTSHTRPSD